MSIAEVQFEKIDQSLKLRDGEHHFLLLSSGLFKNVLSEVSKIDFYCNKRWLWEDTPYDEHKTEGPLLLKVDPKSKLLTQYLQQYSELDQGVLIISAASIEDVRAHLQKFLQVFIDQRAVRFRIEDPRRLAGVFTALNKDRLAYFLGPVSRVVFRENNFDQSRWMMTINKTSAEDKVLKDFSFSSAEIKTIEKYQLRYFLKKCARELEIEFSIGPEQSFELAKTYAGKAMHAGFTEEANTVEVVKAMHAYRDFNDSEDFEAILYQEIPESRKLYEIRQYVHSKDIREDLNG